jgi:hypothetical protein
VEGNVGVSLLLAPDFSQVDTGRALSLNRLKRFTQKTVKKVEE